jgi:hypothetical protein
LQEPIEPCSSVQQPFHPSSLRFSDDKSFEMQAMLKVAFFHFISSEFDEVIEKQAVMNKLIAIERIVDYIPDIQNRVSNVEENMRLMNHSIGIILRKLSDTTHTQAERQWSAQNKAAGQADDQASAAAGHAGSASGGSPLPKVGHADPLAAQAHDGRRRASQLRIATPRVGAGSNTSADPVQTPRRRSDGPRHTAESAAAAAAHRRSADSRDRPMPEAGELGGDRWPEASGSAGWDRRSPPSPPAACMAAGWRARVLRGVCGICKADPRMGIEGSRVVRPDSPLNLCA